jgi:hypothetical protein
MPRYVRKSTLAEACGVGPSRISNLCKGRFAQALARDGTLDIDHPEIAAYMREHGASDEDVGYSALAAPVATDGAGAPPAPGVPDDIDQYAEMTLRQLIDQFGTDEKFEVWLKSLKTIGEIEDRRLKNATAKSQLISRDVVDRYVFGVIEATYTRLLNDSPKTIAGQVRAAVKAGQTTEEIEAMVRDLISSQIKGIKEKARRGLKDA